MRSQRRVSAALWIAAFVVTIVLVLFQRITGPSYPARGSFASTDGERFDYRLPRSNEGRPRLVVVIPSPDRSAEGFLEWRRYPTDEPFRVVRMSRTAGDRLEAVIPSQPAAGKVEYRVRFEEPGGTVVVPPPEEQPVVARFRGKVPAAILIPHILAMFVSMFLATRSLFEVLHSRGAAGGLMVVFAMAFLIIGGLILGPIVQKEAFGAFWTGWPIGEDLTDTKTLIATLAWLPATIMAIARRRLRLSVGLGWLVMMGVFMVPHSMRGSQLDWSGVDTPATPVKREADRPG